MTASYPFNLKVIDQTWHSCIEHALGNLNANYIQQLSQTPGWLPGPDKIFNAFSLPVNKINYVLLGESPYPRAKSANGYAFWDAAVEQIWSPTGLSKPVNRATSLRNIIKMLLIAEGLLDPRHTTQDDIAKVNKQGLIQTNHELFSHLIEHGFLLLNATLVLQPTQVQKDAKAWQPFLKSILDYLAKYRPNVQLLLFGNIANTIDKHIDKRLPMLCAEHPYNISFITNDQILNFFKPFHLLRQGQTSQ